MLMRPEYRNKIDPKYKKKIEDIVRWEKDRCCFLVCDQVGTQNVFFTLFTFIFE